MVDLREKRTGTGAGAFTTKPECASVCAASNRDYMEDRQRAPENSQRAAEEELRRAFKEACSRGEIDFEGSAEVGPLIVA